MALADKILVYAERNLHSGASAWADNFNLVSAINSILRALPGANFTAHIG